MSLQLSISKLISPMTVFKFLFLFFIFYGSFYCWCNWTSAPSGVLVGQAVSKCKNCKFIIEKNDYNFTYLI